MLYAAICARLGTIRQGGGVDRRLYAAIAGPLRTLRPDHGPVGWHRNSKSANTGWPAGPVEDQLGEPGQSVALAHVSGQRKGYKACLNEVLVHS